MFAGSQPQFSQSQGDAPEKRQRSEGDKQSCLPATVRIIQTAISTKSEGDGELQIFGVEPGILILVGVVEAFSQQAAALEFTLNDGTGRIRVRHFVTGETPLDATSEGRYVCVAGQIKTSPEPHVTAVGLRLVRSPDEVSYHLIEAAHAALKLQKGDAPARERLDAVATPMKAPVMAAPAAEPAAAPATSAAVAAAVAPTAPAAPLPSDAIVAEYIRSLSDRPEGLTINDLCGRFTSASAAQILAIIQRLIELGEVYNTIDEDHFGAI